LCCRKIGWFTRVLLHENEPFAGLANGQRAEPTEFTGFSGFTKGEPASGVRRRPRRAREELDAQARRLVRVDR
jgi:hypothetical protein